MKGQKLAILKALRQAKTAGLTGLEIYELTGSMRFSARIKELRDVGYTISSEHVRGSVYRYRLLSESATQPPPPKASPDPVEGGLFDLDTYRDRSSTPHYLSDVEAA